MTLKKIYNGHFRRVPSSSEKADKSFCSEKSVEMLSESKSFENKGGYGIVNNILYGAGLGVGAVGFSLAILSSTLLASSVLFSTYFCANTCNVNEDDMNDDFI
ncbi:hypothetical protein PRSY57_0930000 [Plasmodium reichenowi]|uniref:Uncharacterized protein n=1 Tax=Plasmodium reichenowi TaxID=5854 RepID=A0A151LI03_PLARE|nr:hypothetical protein PRSY57_0930000 [Plasmodium reichenowi]KYN98615.1 hypothetical protein PRSY57_0930000 [Plasmodium reichenowi]